MVFMEHGLFEVKIEGKLLLVDATGPFNEELLIQYEKALETCIHTLEISEWNQVIILHQLSLFTPEAEQVLTNTVINRRSRGLIACAIVLINVEGESLIKTQMSRCYDRARVKHNFTTSIHEANKWLATL
ncbi:hypothetical protein A9Q75_15725 [Colwellia psychrerythraea]|uniref:STAS/SEC14 domain-containing protein n=1 Tax=Colwellia psychrerythraea TaxID=28229 RepID=A0A1Y5E6S8_COLPS|nr:hypothetical protein A9Q75_15725 [Colwellia psychrerythraea]